MKRKLVVFSIWFVGYLLIALIFGWEAVAIVVVAVFLWKLYRKSRRNKA